MKRRANHEGSLCHRKDGRWYARITVAGVLRHKYARTQTECRAWLKAMQERDNQPPAGNRVSLADYLDWWLNKKQPTVRANTYRQYEMILRLHIVPALGTLPLADVTAAHLEGLYRSHYQSGAFDQTGRVIHRVLHHALAQAVRWNLITRNPADGVDCPRLLRGQRRYLTPDQVRRFLEAARWDRLEVLWLLAVHTGMRQGELLGLTWQDVDLEAGIIHVRQQLTNVPGQPLALSALKTQRSQRDIVLGAGLIERLRRYRAEMPGELLFPSLAGTPADRRNLVRMFKALLVRAGLPDMRFHDLRHTAASLMAAEGVHPSVMQERMGHTDVAMTLGVYTHVADGLQRRAAEALERATGMEGK